MTASPAIETIGRQAPTALLAIVQHINDHQLGVPLSIHAPTDAAPAFGITVASYGLDAWAASGFDVTHEHTELVGGRVLGSRWERVVQDGLLQPYGVRVRLTSHRAVPAMAVTA
jgi:hypothetical protein